MCQSNVEQVDATIKSTVEQKHSLEDTRHGIPDMFKASNVLWIGNMGNEKGKPFNSRSDRDENASLDVWSE